MVGDWTKVYREATRRFNAGEKAEDLAVKYGVSLQQMQRIIEQSQSDIHLTDEELDARAEAEWIAREEEHRAYRRTHRACNAVDSYVRRVRSIWHNEVVKPWRASNAPS